MKAVFFDLDGTLLDTIGDIREALNDVLTSFGFAPVSVEDAKRYVGNGAEMLIRRAIGNSNEFSAVLSAFRTRYAASKNDKTLSISGMKELLLSLKARGVKLAVVTNKPQEATVHVIQKFYPDIFDYAAGDDGSFPLKPDPTLCRYLALSMHASPRDCAVVGDGETDIETARRAGMLPVAVLWGYRSRAVLEQAGAKVFAEDTASLAKILEKFCEIY